MWSSEQFSLHYEEFWGKKAGPARNVEHLDIQVKTWTFGLYKKELLRAGKEPEGEGQDFGKLWYGNCLTITLWDKKHCFHFTHEKPEAQKLNHLPKP